MELACLIINPGCSWDNLADTALYCLVLLCRSLAQVHPAGGLVPRMMLLVQRQYPLQYWNRSSRTYSSSRQRAAAQQRGDHLREQVLVAVGVCVCLQCYCLVTCNVQFWKCGIAAQQQPLASWAVQEWMLAVYAVQVADICCTSCQEVDVCSSGFTGAHVCSVCVVAFLQRHVAPKLAAAGCQAA